MGKEIKLRREEKKGKERGRKKKEKKKKKKGKKGRGLGKKIKRGGEENQDSCNYIHACLLVLEVCAIRPKVYSIIFLNKKTGATTVKRRLKGVDKRTAKTLDLQDYLHCLLTGIPKFTSSFQMRYEKRVPYIKKIESRVLEK